MKRQIIPAAVVASLSLGAGAAIAAPARPTTATSPHFSGHELAGAARVSLVEARRVALKARPGAITDEELETERGGSGLRYSFDIKADHATYEVGVDAKTGKVLENKREGKNPD